MNLQTLGKKIASMRKQKQFTQQQVAEKCGLTKDRISEIENGHANITFEALFKICEALECKCELRFIDS